MYIYTHTHVYIIVYLIHAGERAQTLTLTDTLCLSASQYIYIYTHTHIIVYLIRSGERAHRHSPSLTLSVSLSLSHAQQYPVDTNLVGELGQVYSMCVFELIGLVSAMICLS